MLSPIAPDWLMKPTGPYGGIVGAKVAFIANSAALLRTPMQFGPTMRIP